MPIRRPTLIYGKENRRQISKLTSICLVSISLVHHEWLVVPRNLYWHYFYDLALRFVNSGFSVFGIILYRFEIRSFRPLSVLSVFFLNII